MTRLYVAISVNIFFMNERKPLTIALTHVIFGDNRRI